MSKCDFRVSVVQSASNPAEWKLAAGSLEADGLRERFDKIKAQVPHGALNVAASKCDWSVEMLQNKVAQFNQPMANAKLVASGKCDFRINLEFGLQEGRRFRIGAVSSSKCDFRLDKIETFDPRTQKWAAAPPPAPKKE